MSLWCVPLCLPGVDPRLDGMPQFTEGYHLHSLFNPVSSWPALSPRVSRTPQASAFGNHSKLFLTNRVGQRELCFFSGPLSSGRVLSVHSQENRLALQGMKLSVFSTHLALILIFLKMT